MSHAARCAHHWQMARDRYSIQGTVLCCQYILYCTVLYCTLFYVQRQGMVPRAGGGGGCGCLAAGVWLRGLLCLGHHSTSSIPLLLDMMLRPYKSFDHETS